MEKRFDKAEARVAKSRVGTCGFGADFLSLGTFFQVGLKGNQMESQSTKSIWASKSPTPHFDIWSCAFFLEGIEIVTRSADASGQSPINKLGLMLGGALNALEEEQTTPL